jgi:NADPH2:quinone reductase
MQLHRTSATPITSQVRIAVSCHEYDCEGCPGSGEHAARYGRDMRSVQVVALAGPTGVEVVDAAEPVRADQQLLVEVRALGVSWPDLLQSRGEYQLKPDVPFQLGVDFAGVVRETAEGSGFGVGERVACCLPYGGGAELVAVHPDSVFPVPDVVSLEKAAALPMNYLTAQFALRTRAQLRDGETVLVHGAAGGVGTAALQVAKGYG